MYIKIMIQESVPTVDVNSKRENLETIHESITRDPKVAAGFLRAVADKYDPPKAAMR